MSVRVRVCACDPLCLAGVGARACVCALARPRKRAAEKRVGLVALSKVGPHSSAARPPPPPPRRALAFLSSAPRPARAPRWAPLPSVLNHAEGGR